ncbi:MAG TPA: aspartyl protease family protein [Methylomirabilota bacterium]|nr:aspartyl protease family protein [Methylomirabilota bacterium]
MKGLAALATALLLSLLAPGAVRAELYRWTDADGTVHYTTDVASIPEQFRDSATDIGSPTPGPVLPATPAVPPGAVIPYGGGPLVVDASINGVPLRLVVDTGAERTLISPAALARAGLDPSVGPAVHIRGVTGDATATLVSVPRLDVAGAQVGPLAVIAHALQGESVDGLLGRDVLDGFTVTVDAAQSRATLVPR